MVFGIALLFTGLFMGIMGYALDEATAIHLGLIASNTMPVSQERVDTVHWMLVLFRALALLIPLGLGISLWAVSTRETPGEV